VWPTDGSSIVYLTGSDDGLIQSRMARYNYTVELADASSPSRCSSF
jgi:hypothetical protein